MTDKVTEAELKELFFAKEHAHSIYAALAARDTNRLPLEDRFTADLEYQRALKVAAKAAEAYGRALQRFLAAEQAA